MSGSRRGNETQDRSLCSQEGRPSEALQLLLVIRMDGIGRITEHCAAMRFMHPQWKRHERFRFLQEQAKNLHENKFPVEVHKNLTIWFPELGKEILDIGGSLCYHADTFRALGGSSCSYIGCCCTRTTAARPSPNHK